MTEDESIRSGELMDQWAREREAEKVAKAARTVALFAFAGELAGQLGPEWELTPVKPGYEFSESHPHVRRTTDGAEFWIGEDWRDKGRVDVHCNWPKDAQGREQRPYFSQYSENGAGAPTITFARTKTPAQAARDITRRFLPGFLPLWEKQAITVQAATDYIGRRAALAARVAAILGGTVEKDRHDDGRAIVRLRHRERGIREVEFSDKDSEIVVKITCTLDELAALAPMFPVKGQA